MERRTKEAVQDMTVLGGGVALAILLMLAGCTKTVYVDRPTDVPTAAPTPSPPAVSACRSVPIKQGDCHKTDQDVYLAQYTAATDAAFLNPAVMWKDEITNGSAYLAFIVANLQGQGLCAGIYENEEVAVWGKADQSFSENWDTVAEPGSGGIKQRLGPGAHSFSCWPATTESGS